MDERISRLVEKIQSGRRERIWKQRDRRGVLKDNGSSRAGSGASSTGVSHQSAGKAESKDRTLPAGEKRESVVTCYKCGNTRHLSKNCVNEKRVITCFVCKRPSHIASRCQSNVNNKEKTNVGEVKVIDGKSTSDVGRKFLREINIGSYKLTAQIDTGATICTIKSTAVIQKDFNIIARRTILEGFGGKIVESPGSINEKVQIDDLKPRELKLLTVPDTAQRCDVILGQPFTEAHDINYTRYGSELKFIDVDISVLKENSSSKARALERMNLEPYC